MNNKILECLLADDFRGRMCFVATPTALRRLLQRSPEVRVIRWSLETGILDEDAISRFVFALMNDLRPGSPFLHDLAICALAVALEKRGTAFAERFLSDLAGLQAAEMSMSIRVARDCLKSRTLISSTATAVLQMAEAKTNFRFGQAVPSFISKDVRSTVQVTPGQSALLGYVAHAYAEPSLATLPFRGQ